MVDAAGVFIVKRFFESVLRVVEEAARTAGDRARAMRLGGRGGGTQYPLEPAAALLATLPVAALFFCFQRYFMRWTNAGAVKE
ncbi:hypothetical protein [Streptomyces coffeae]|uniref:hypothetical protein n=1 Tax=Streptomyces coffeae TaxID=621382 RepID=UPI001F39BBD9|nr:hypothetical protein [Streptomyces coffeae]